MPEGLCDVAESESTSLTCGFKEGEGMILRIEDIAVDQTINLRDVDLATVAEYCEAMERGDHFPAIGVVNDGETKWLYAGFHRIQAAQEAGLEHFEAEIRDGTRNDALSLACAENAEHGKARSNQEKRDAVVRMLELEPDWSDRQIARWCKVGNQLVGKVRESHTVFSHSINQERTFIHHKTGKPTTMKTGNIGRNANGQSASANQLGEAKHPAEFRDSLPKPSSDQGLADRHSAKPLEDKAPTLDGGRQIIRSIQQVSSDINSSDVRYLAETLIQEGLADTYDQMTERVIERMMEIKMEIKMAESRLGPDGEQPIFPAVELSDEYKKNRDTHQSRFHREI